MRVSYVFCFQSRSGHIYQNQRFDSSTTEQELELNELRHNDAATVNMYDIISSSTRPCHRVTYTNQDSEYADLEIHVEYAYMSHIYNTLSLYLCRVKVVKVKRITHISIIRI